MWIVRKADNGWQRRVYTILRCHFFVWVSLRWDIGIFQSDIHSPQSSLGNESPVIVLDSFKQSEGGMKLYNV